MPALQGIKVLDLSRYLPGPLLSQELLRHGADVIRVEHPALPDFLREEPFNRGKRCLTLDYRTLPGSQILQRLASQSDIWIESARPGVMDRLGLGASRLCEQNPRLIYLSLSGYGQSGPWSERGGHDLNFLARSGLGDALEGLPRIQLADVGAALLAHSAILTALLERHHTGRGQQLDVSLADAAYLLQKFAHEELDGSSPVYRYYQASDGTRIAVACLEPKFQAGLLRLLQLPPSDQDMARDPDWHGRLEAIFRQHPGSYWAELFDAQDICVDVVLTRTQAAESSWALARHPELAAGPIAQPGRDNKAILSEAGYSHEQIQDWSQQGLL